MSLPNSSRPVEAHFEHSSFATRVYRHGDAMSSADFSSLDLSFSVADWDWGGGDFKMYRMLEGEGRFAPKVAPRSADFDPFCGLQCIHHRQEVISKRLHCEASLRALRGFCDTQNSLGKKDLFKDLRERQTISAKNKTTSYGLYRAHDKRYI